MKKYVKPSMNIIELQLKENIAALPTTVFKGSKANKSHQLLTIALSAANTGLEGKITDGEDVLVS